MGPLCRIVGAIAAACTVMALSAAPAVGTPARAVQDQIVLSGRVDVPRGRTVGQVVLFRGLASIEGVARGDVVVVSGRVIVSGQVSGNVVDLDGSVVLAPTAQVRGDVIARGSVVVRRGAQVQGDVRQTVPFTLRGVVGAIGGFASWLAVSLSTLVLGLLMLWLVPRGSAAILASARGAPWSSAAWGIVLAVVGPVVTAAVAATLVGLPLALATIVLLGLLLFLGYVWCAWILGRVMLREPRGRVVAYVAGLGVLRLIALVPVVGAVAWAAAATFGLGSMTVATWRARGVGGKHRLGRPASVFETPEAAAGEETVPEAGAGQAAQTPDEASSTV
jgi:hypothetical protein